jgi:hypothetical protein
MSASQERQPTLNSVTPRFLAGDMEQALTFYGQIGFATPSHDEGFAIIERDSIALQFNVFDPTHEPPQEGCRVCSINVTNIEALYQQYVPTGALRSTIQTTDWGTKGFWLCDPFRNILIFEESIAVSFGKPILAILAQEQEEAIGFGPLIERANVNCSMV